MNNTINPYQVLGVPDRSDIKICQKAYRKLALKYHPDRCKDPKGHEKMILINQCMDFLKDPIKKAQLDAPQPIIQYANAPMGSSYTVKWYYGSSSTGGSWR